MPKFAIYYVPRTEEPFYRLGTSILGYDVRARTAVTLPSDLREDFGQFDTSWTGISRPYGFHLTITEAIDCSWAMIPQVERELTNLPGCFDPAHPFVLRRLAESPVGIWGEMGRNSLVLLYEPNEYLRMLHTLIVARINPLGLGSGFLKHYLAHPEQELQPHQAQQIRLFYSPTCWIVGIRTSRCSIPIPEGIPRAWPRSSRGSLSRIHSSPCKRSVCSSRWMRETTGISTRSFAVPRHLFLYRSKTQSYPLVCCPPTRFTRINTTGTKHHTATIVIVLELPA